MKFGVFDTEDKLWIGNTEAPAMFDDEKLAAVAALIVDKRLGQRMGRTRALPYDEKTEAHLRDEVQTVMSDEQALAELEEGR